MVDRLFLPRKASSRQDLSPAAASCGGKRQCARTEWKFIAHGFAIGERTVEDSALILDTREQASDSSGNLWMTSNHDFGACRAFLRGDRPTFRRHGNFQSHGSACSILPVSLSLFICVFSLRSSLGVPFHASLPTESQ